MAKSKMLEQTVFGLLLTGFMSLIISGISTARVVGLERVADAPLSFLSAWLASYVMSWAVAFPVVLVVAPLVRRIVTLLFAERSAVSTAGTG